MADPTGRQPQENGRLQCLDCGNWYRILAPHLGAAHGTTAADYRDAHRLPRQLSLRATDLNERARQQGQGRYAARPDIRAHMAAGRATIDLATAVQGTRATARYEMVLATRRHVGAGRKAAARTRIDARAAAAGYPTIEAYFEARQGSPVAGMARELGISRATVNRWLEQT
jgi:ROS/MUCR transcriptional regulator protein